MPLPPASRVKKPKMTKAENQKVDDKADEDDAKKEEQKDGEPKNEKKKGGRPANAAGNDDAKTKLMNKLLASTAAK